MTGQPKLTPPNLKAPRNFLSRQTMGLKRKNLLQKAKVKTDNRLDLWNKKPINKVKKMKTARTILKIICIAGLMAVLTSTSWGIDRVKKNQSPKEPKEKVSQGDTVKEKTPPETKSQPQGQSDKSVMEENPKVEKKAPEPDAQKIKRAIKEDYDYFIDKNKNGIDDRLETKEKPKPAPKEIKSKKKNKPE